MLERVCADFPHLKVIATSLRQVKSASLNHFSGICYADGRLVILR